MPVAAYSRRKSRAPERSNVVILTLASFMKAISILGSTGSIGCNTLKVIEHLGNYRVVALAAGRNMPKLAEQIARFRPDIVSCENGACVDDLLTSLRSLNVSEPEIVFGEEGLVAVATHTDAEILVSAAVGSVGFIPTLRAIEAGKRIALANKETLVMAGELMTRAAVESRAQIIPVDSEHNAIHQCLRGERREEVKRLILTASGGPFRTWSTDEIEHATPDQALAHPNWSMGDKITIDSATLMNKGLEVIEAQWLFGFDADQISVVVHPQSVIHSMIEMIDGSIIAQLGVTDMRHPIQYALTYPDRRTSDLSPLDLAKMGAFTFEEPDLEKFPCLALAFEALKAGGTMPAVLNAANETTVNAFLQKRIAFCDISTINRAVMDGHNATPADTIDAVMTADRAAREASAKFVEDAARTAIAA
jgi:1-deoxy-D-xylulose-5-phosphate reductoisomerase